MKNTIIALVIIIILGVGGYMFMKNPSNNGDDKTKTTQTDNTGGNATTTEVVDKTKTVIGTSVSGNAITAYHYGEGADELLLVYGIHGGYEWNTVLLGQQVMDYLKANPSVIPSNLKVTVIPVLNPDGLNKVVGTTTTMFTKADVSSKSDVVTSGRFNANNVDLNRNFDCDWKTDAKWQNKSVSGGASAFSESESSAIKNYVETNKPVAVVAWFSAAGGVFSSSCHNNVSATTTEITKSFAKASGYTSYEKWDFYSTTGDMMNWLAKINTPAISVLLTDHTNTEFSKNQKGIDALLKYYAK